MSTVCFPGGDMANGLQGTTRWPLVFEDTVCYRPFSIFQRIYNFMYACPYLAVYVRTAMVRSIRWVSLIGA